MSATMSSPSEWVQFYRRTLAGQVTPPDHHSLNTIFGGGRVSDATVVTTTVTSPTPTSTPNAHLNPEGRVSKPIRRRSRASKRTPTTLLNTDTANFRAMVQQFTGNPSTPFSSAGSRSSAVNFNFGHHLNGNPISESSEYYHNQQQQQQQHLFTLNSNASDHVLLQRFSNMTRPNLETSDHQGLVMEGYSSHVLPRPFL